MGIHVCEFPDCEKDSLYGPTGSREFDLFIRVRGELRWYRVVEMLLHYCDPTGHDWRPPDDFIDAIMNGNLERTGVLQSKGAASGPKLERVEVGYLTPKDGPIVTGPKPEGFMILLERIMVQACYGQDYEPFFRRGDFSNVGVRGFHVCSMPLCPGHEGVYATTSSRDYTLRFAIAGWITVDLQMPTAIMHYLVDHRWKPDDILVQAVLDGECIGYDVIQTRGMGDHVHRVRVGYLTDPLFLTGRIDQHDLFVERLEQHLRAAADHTGYRADFRWTDLEQQHQR